MHAHNGSARGSHTLESSTALDDDHDTLRSKRLDVYRYFIALLDILTPYVLHHTSCL